MSHQLQLHQRQQVITPIKSTTSSYFPGDTMLLIVPRPASPGDTNAVFGICVLEVKKTGTRSAPYEQTNIEPCGTAFSISPSLVLTAFHNLVSGNRMCLVKSLTIGESSKVLRSDVINLKASPIYANENDDWAILEREVGTFNTFAEICGHDGELPSENSDIAIKHFPVGLIDSSSVARLRVVSTMEKLIFFSPRLPPPDVSSAAKKSKLIGPLKFTITDNPSEIVEKAADVAVASNSLSRGSCGAPYFALNNKVFAFHVESVNDDINVNVRSKSSSTSHQSYCHGYVICRLASLMDALGKLNIGNP